MNSNEAGGNLLTVSNYGLVGKLFNNVGNDINDVVCRLLGPNFLQVLLNYNGCPNGVRLPYELRSYAEFCAFYNGACQSTKKCLTERAVQIQIKLKGIVDYHMLIGRCCARCGSRYIC